MLISAGRALKEGGRIKRLHRFSENSGGDNGHLFRQARYGEQWIRTPDGSWIELTTAYFTHDLTGKSDRCDRCMGLESGIFFLNHSGFLDGYTEYGTSFDRPRDKYCAAGFRIAKDFMAVGVFKGFAMFAGIFP